MAHVACANPLPSPASWRGFAFKSFAKLSLFEFCEIKKYPKWPILISRELRAIVRNQIEM
jgi:hypothetical protein